MKLVYLFRRRLFSRSIALLCCCAAQLTLLQDGALRLLDMGAVLMRVVSLAIRQRHHGLEPTGAPSSNRVCDGSS